MEYLTKEHNFDNYLITITHINEQMKTVVLFLSILMLGVLNTFAQTHNNAKTYTSLEEALKNPLKSEVFSIAFKIIGFLNELIKSFVVRRILSFKFFHVFFLIFPSSSFG